MKRKTRFIFSLLALICFARASHAQAQPRELILEFVPAETTVKFSLSASLHTVHGSFQLKGGNVHFDPGTGQLTGDLVVDATSGESGNSSRDRKMHKEVLQSAQYPQITFHPDRVEGQVMPQGTSTVQVHGTFSIHGAEHEINVPVQVEMASDHWSITAHIVVPYVKWGMKNPSTFILHVPDSVEIDIHASGAVVATTP